MGAQSDCCLPQRWPDRLHLSQKLEPLSGAPGNFCPARLWAFVPGWQQRPVLYTHPRPQVIVVSPGQEGEEGAGAGYRPPLKG